jgi:hypothetical protein
VRKRCYKGQDTIVYDSNLDRVPWVVSTISCSQDTASLLLLAILLIMLSYLFENAMLLLSNHQCCHFSAIRLNTGIFLDWPIREIVSLYFLPNRKKVLLFCYSYSAWYQYPYFQVQIEMANTGNLLFTFRYIM